MIDTIKLMTSEFNYNPSLFGENTHRPQGSDEIKQFYFFNNPVTGSKFEVINNRLFFTASIPRLISGHSLNDLQDSDFDKAVNLIETDFKNAKVTTADRINELELSRLDYCKNIKIENQISDYMKVLSMQTIARKNKMNWTDETLLFKNQSSEFTIYNKIKQLIQTGHDVQKTENVLRFESRLKKASAIKRNMLSFCPALKSIKKVNNLTFEHAFNSELSRKQLMKDFDSFKISDIDIIQEYKFNDMQLIEYLKKQSSTGYVLTVFIKLQGYENLIEKYSADFDVLHEIFKSFANKSTASRQMKNIKTYMQQTRPHIKTVSDELIRKIMTELDYKLKAAA